MRLGSSSLAIPPELVSELNKLGIMTDTDLLFCDTPLAIFQKLPQNTIALKDLKALVSRVAGLCAAPGIVAIEMPPLTRTALSSGLDSLDMITGSFEGSLITEISGDTGSGKTSIALNLAFHLLDSNPTSSVLWIDTRGDFATDRAISMIKEMNSTSMDILDRLQVSTAIDLDAVYGVLWSLTLLSSYQNKCIIIDNVTNLLASYFSATSSQGHAIMTGFMRYLRETAISRNLTIIVINDASLIRDGISSSVFDWTTKKPALGPSFAFQSDTTLWLSKRNTDDTLHYAEILHSRSTTPKTFCPFILRNGILYEATPTVPSPTQ